MIREDFEIFNKQRNSLDFKMVDLEKKMIDMAATKMPLVEAEETFKNIEDRLKTESWNNTKNRDSIITLENYVERYVPMQILKTVTRAVKPVLPPE